MAWKNQNYTLLGTAPLLLHNGEMANPFNYYTKLHKKIAAKRGKTEADHAEIARISWYGSLYLNEDKHVCIPGRVFEAVVIKSASASRRKDKAKAGVEVRGMFPLIYEGPKNIDELWEIEAFRFTTMAIIDRKRVLVTRPIFEEWQCTFTVHYNDNMLNLADLTDIVIYGGENLGIGAWHPKYGRFAIAE